MPILFLYFRLINKCVFSNFLSCTTVSYTSLVSLIRLWDVNSDQRFTGLYATDRCYGSVDSLVRSMSLTSVNDINSCFSNQCSQIFIGMITMQYQAKQVRTESIMQSRSEPIVSGKTGQNRKYYAKQVRTDSIRQNRSEPMVPGKTGQNRYHQAKPVRTHRIRLNRSEPIVLGHTFQNF